MFSNGVEISPEDIKYLSKNVLKLGAYAKRFLNLYDFGTSAQQFMSHVKGTHYSLNLLPRRRSSSAIVLRPTSHRDDGLWDDVSDTWDYSQTLRFAAGATMISEKYKSYMSRENLKKSLVAKVLFKCQTGILDDLIDKGHYSYIEAKDLYHHVLSSMTDPDFEINAFKKELVSLMNRDQLHLFDLVTSITTNFNKLFNQSPHGHDLFYHMEVLDEQVILGQALTMFQKERFFNLQKIKNLAEKFYAPSRDLAWHERLAKYVSGGTRYNLIDISFTDGGFDIEDIKSLLTGWYYFDAVIVYLNNIVHVYRDLRSGICNLSLIAMKEKELESVKRPSNYNPKITLQDYKKHIDRLAELVGRAFKHVTENFEDKERYYPFITIMMPVVMMADWIGKRDDLMDAYLRAISSAVKAVSLAPNGQNRKSSSHEESKSARGATNSWVLAPVASEKVRSALKP